MDRLRTAWIAALAVGIVASAVLLARDAAPQAGGTPPAGNAAAARAEDGTVRELAERLLTSPQNAPAGAGGSGAATLFVGGTPPDLGFDVPVPATGRLVGSVRRTADGAAGATIEVAVDAPGRTSDVLAFYERELVAGGWSISPAAGPRGFVGTLSTVTSAYCRGTRDFLTLHILPRAGAPADVRLVANTSDGVPCGDAPAARPVIAGGDKLPLLVAPDGVAVETYGPFPSGQDRWTSEASARTPLPVSDLERAYAAQLSALGWTRSAGHAAPLFAWSTWRLPDAGWQGVLSVNDAPGGQRSLFIRVEGPGSP